MFHVKHLGGTMIKGVIFDFNGTLFFDSWIHQKIWLKILSEVIGQPPTPEMMDVVNGQVNFQMIKSFNKYRKIPLSDDEINRYSEKKEAIYRNYVLEHNLNKLEAGALELFEYLKENNISMVLCSASIKENIDFFFNSFGLKDYFIPEQSVYDDGSYHNKVAMYKKACENIGIDIKDALIFEDSKFGVKWAIEAGCKNIVLLKSSQNNLKFPEIIQEINNFTEFNYDILKK